MRANKLGRTLGTGVAVIAAFYTLAQLVMPVVDRRVPIPVVLVWLVVLLTHAAFYVFGPEVRDRFGLRAYVGLQVALVLALGLSGAFMPVAAALYFALTIETVILAGSRWGSAPIAIGAMVLFCANAAIVWDLYRAASIGVMLAITGFIARAVAGLMQRSEPVLVTNGEPAAATNGGSSTLTAREMEVLRGIIAGSRSSQIAIELRITERTVKAHLASIYMKLGVESRAGAVAAALQRGLAS